MELQTLANIGEFMGGIGVIISLIYVGFQVRGNTRSQQSDITARTLDRFSSMQREMASNAELCKTFNIGLIDPGKLSITDRIRFTWWMTEFFSTMEFLCDQHQLGNISDPIYQRWTQTLRWWLAYPGALLWWHGRPTPFTPSFTALVERLLAEEYHAFNDLGWQNFMLGSQVAN